MSKLKPTKLTNAGMSLLMSAISGEAKIQFTKMAFGNGNYIDDTELVHQTALKSSVQTVQINDITAKSDTCICLSSVLSNEDLKTGYKITEVGLFAKDISKSDSSEILYAICIAEEGYADYFPAFNNYAPVRLLQDFYIDVADSTSTTIAVDDKTVATREYVDNRFLSTLNCLTMNKSNIPSTSISVDDNISTGLYLYKCADVNFPLFVFGFGTKIIQLMIPTTNSIKIRSASYSGNALVWTAWNEIGG